jgi:hypothetical protein
LGRMCSKGDWRRRGLFDRVNILIFPVSFEINFLMARLIIYWTPSISENSDIPILVYILCTLCSEDFGDYAWCV